MYVYSVSSQSFQDSATGTIYFDNVKEAREAAQEAADDSGLDVTVEREEIESPITRKTAVGMLNHWGFVKSRKVVYVAHPVDREESDDL